MWPSSMVTVVDLSVLVLFDKYQTLSILVYLSIIREV